MFFHQFKHTIRCFTRAKMSLFWILAFPIVLVTFYDIAFAGVLDSETIPEVNMGIVKGQYADDSFQEAAQSSGLFKVSVLSEAEARAKLDAGDLDLYVTDLEEAADKEGVGQQSGGSAGEGETAGNIRIVTGGNGVGQSIAKLFADAYSQITAAAEEISSEVQEKALTTGNAQLMEQVFTKFKDLNVSESNVKHEPLGGSTNPLVIFYYGAIAMSVMFSSFSGVSAVIFCQANQSITAGKVNISPIRKMTAFFGTCAAYYLLQIAAITLMILYIKYVIKLDIGGNSAMIMLVLYIGEFTGICLGAMVGVLIKRGIKIKEAILQVVCIFGGFLAGMMSMDIKYYVHEYLPLVEKINPANLICDSLYALYFYNDANRVFGNLGTLLVEGALFAAVAIWILRRKNYASL